MPRDKNEDLKVVDRFWDDFSESELSDLLSRFPDAGSFVRVVRPGGRPLNVSALVETERGTFFVKRRLASTRTPSMLTEEHRFVDHVRRAGIPTPEFIRTREGHTFCTQSEWLVEVQTSADGDDLYVGRHTWQPFLSETHALSLGETFRRIRDAAASFPSVPVGEVGSPSGRFVLAKADDLADAVAKKIDSEPASRAFFESRRAWLKELDVFEPFLEVVRTWLRETPESWVHGDPQANNCLYRNDKVASVIDFHLSAPAPPLLDLAVAVDRNTLLWLDILAGNDDAADWRGLEALLKGYGPLTAEETKVLPALVAVCQLDFAIELMQYYLRVERSPSKATWCWEAYLVGHTRWHLSDAGRRFADVIASS